MHVFSASYLSFLLAPLPAVLIARLLGKPVVMNYRSGEAPDHLKRSRIARSTLRRVAANVVPSAFLQKVFAQFEIPADIIPNIVDLDLFAFRARRHLRPHMLCTRNLEPMYNVACTLRAFEIIQASYPDATLTLVGAGSQAESLRELVAVRGLRNVHFAGAVAPSDMWRYYANADIYIQTPEIDNMPTSVLEAFSSGCVVVSTAAGGVPTILEDGVHGSLVPCGDHAAAADRVLTLLAAPDLARQFTVQARQTCERYRWSTVRAQWLDLYRGLASRGAANISASWPSPSTQLPVKVAIVAPSLRILGGQAVQAQRLIEAWTEDAEIRAHLVPINPLAPPPLDILEQVKFIRTAITQILYWPLLFRALKSADIVHVFSASYWSFLLAPLPAMLVARLLGKPLIVNYRSGEAPDHLSRSAVARFALRRADCNVVPSTFLHDVFAQFGISTEIIPDIVDLDQFAFRAREVFQPRFLCTRNFEPLYNVSCTLRAFAIVQRSYPDATLTLVGSGSQRDALERLASTLKLRNVEFVGAVPPDDIWQYYADCDIYLQTPDIDNLPASVLEAFASGCVVISTNAGGMPTILTDGVDGYMVPLDDHVAAAERAIRVIEDPRTAQRLAVVARESCERYRWSDVRVLWLSLYQNRMKRAGAVAAPMNA